MKCEFTGSYADQVFMCQNCGAFPEECSDSDCCCSFPETPNDFEELSRTWKEFKYELRQALLRLMRKL